MKRMLGFSAAGLFCLHEARLNADRVLESDQPVVIDGRWAELTARSMRVDLEAGTAVFDGNVKGWLDRDLS